MDTMQEIIDACKTSVSPRMKKDEKLPAFIRRLVEANNRAHETLFWIENGPQKGKYTGYDGFDDYIYQDV